MNLINNLQTNDETPIHVLSLHLSHALVRACLGAGKMGGSMSAEEFYIEWCLERHPDAEGLIRDQAKGEGMQEIFSIMEEYHESQLEDLAEEIRLPMVTRNILRKRLLEDPKAKDE